MVSRSKMLGTLLLVTLVLTSTIPLGIHAYAGSLGKEKEYSQALTLINETIDTVKNAQNTLNADPQQALQTVSEAVSSLNQALDLIKEVLQAEGKDYDQLKQEILSQGNKKYDIGEYYIAIAKTGIYVEQAIGNLTEASNSINQGDTAKASSDLTSALSALRSAHDLGVATYNVAIANRESPTIELAIIGLVIASLGLYFIAAHKFERRT